MSPWILEVEGVTGYLEGASGLRRILDGVDLRVVQGRAMALLGESGSGKTFLIQSLLGLHGGLPGLVCGRARMQGAEILAGLDEVVRYRPGEPPRIDKDRVAWNRLQRRNLGDRVGREVTIVPQDPLTALPPFYTVGNLLGRAIRRGNPAATPREVAELSHTWLERVHLYGVDEVLRSYPHELSGGMAQRAALALALAPGPKLLVADEPTTGLDPTLRIRILQLLGTLVTELGITLFLITHDAEAARLLAKDVSVLCAGRIVEVGPAEAVLDPATPSAHPYTRYLLDAERWLAGAFQEGSEPPPAADPGVPRTVPGRGEGVP